MKPPNTSHDPEQSPLPPDIVDALADALATALVRDLQEHAGTTTPESDPLEAEGEQTVVGCGLQA